MSAKPVVSAARAEVRSVVPRLIELTDTLLAMSAARVVKQVFEEKKS